MKKQLLFFLLAILSFNCYAQISFEKGYFIDNDNQKTTCFIKNVDWNNNPTEFEYKLSENDTPKNATIPTVKEFGFDTASKYIRATVNIDRSSLDINKLSREKNPIFKEEVLFLKVLIEGKASLYQYLDDGLTRYFYTVEKSDIEQLVFKKYLIPIDQIAENNKYKQQLLNSLKCPDFNMGKFENLKYDKKKLIKIFTEYNLCNNSKLSFAEPIVKRDFFNLTIRPRINNSSLTITNSGFNEKDKIDFGSKTGFGFGLEAEVILPINKNKWTIFIEPTYQSFKAETTNKNVSAIFGGEFNSKIDYRSIEIPAGLRHYFNLNKYSTVFINVAYVFNLNPNSSVEFSSPYSINNGKIPLDTTGNFAFGIGYKLNDKFGIEMRYQTKRELFMQSLIWSSDYKTFSMILGYTLF